MKRTAIAVASAVSLLFASSAAAASPAARLSISNAPQTRAATQLDQANQAEGSILIYLLVAAAAIGGIIIIADDDSPSSP